MLPQNLFDKLVTVAKLCISYKGYSEEDAGRLLHGLEWLQIMKFSKIATIELEIFLQVENDERYII